MPPSNSVDAFRKVLQSSKRIIAVAGAGLSATSGIPTFRGAGGMWRKYDAISLASPEAFDEAPSKVWQFYHYRREKALKAQPNAAHNALVRFSLESIRHTIAPGSTFTLITQNVDGLSQRAWDSYISSHGITPTEPEQPRMLEMHGRLFDLICNSEDCDYRELNFNSPICEGLGGTEDSVETGSIEDNIPLDKLPHCPRCGGLARPGVVWFGEVPHHMPVIHNLVKKADLCLVVGTSSSVYPAARYASEVRIHGGKVAVFNLDKDAGARDADFLFLGPCEETLPECLGLTPTQQGA